jgi:tRNA nucleotidyltransferase (CCA-adding enzyme)
MPAYLVGGPVRDILLASGHLVLDLDLVVVGDGLVYARRLAEKVGGQVLAHARFLTARIQLSPDLKIDVATARAEVYPQPAALPRVRVAGLKEDLFRRDFTINAMAIRINTSDFGRLVDDYNGQRDLAEGVVRALHAQSFNDDPTRIWRAIRFEQRYHFRLETDTERWLRQALAQAVGQRLTPSRIFNELLLVLAEQEPQPVLQRLADLGVLAWIHPDIRPEVLSVGMLKRLDEGAALADPSFSSANLRSGVLMATLLNGLSQGKTKTLAEHFHFPRRLRELVRIQKSDGERVRLRLESDAGLKPSRCTQLLESLPLEAVILGMAKTSSARVRKIYRRYLASWRKVRPLLSGVDLTRLGYRPGPLFEKILQRLRAGRLDLQLITRQDEERFVRSHFRLPKPPRKKA